MAATVTSRRDPGCPKGGRVAVTITAAVFLTRMAEGCTVTPIRDNRLVSVWAENTVWRLSPVPLRPTTSP